MAENSSPRKKSLSGFASSAFRKLRDRFTQLLSQETKGSPLVVSRIYRFHTCCLKNLQIPHLLSQESTDSTQLLSQESSDSTLVVSRIYRFHTCYLKNLQIPHLLSQEFRIFHDCRTKLCCTLCNLVGYLLLG